MKAWKRNRNYEREKRENSKASRSQHIHNVWKAKQRIERERKSFLLPLRDKKFSLSFFLFLARQWPDFQSSFSSSIHIYDISLLCREKGGFFLPRWTWIQSESQFETALFFLKLPPHVRPVLCYMPPRIGIYRKRTFFRIGRVPLRFLQHFSENSIFLPISKMHLFLAISYLFSLSRQQRKEKERNIDIQDAIFFIFFSKSAKGRSEGFFADLIFTKNPSRFLAAVRKREREKKILCRTHEIQIG